MIFLFYLFEEMENGLCGFSLPASLPCSFICQFLLYSVLKVSLGLWLGLSLLCLALVWVARVPSVTKIQGHKG